MNDDGVGVLIGLLVIALFIFFLVAGYLIGYEEGKSDTTISFQKQAIEHDGAHYDPVTAEFTWNDKTKEYKHD